LKVYLNWGPKNRNAKFRVKANDLESAIAVLSGREEWGKFDSSCPYKWKDGRNGNVASITLTPTFTITMPNWPGYRNQPQKCKDEWDAMWKALYRHENGHRVRFENGISKLVNKLEAMESLKTNEVDAVMSQAKKRMQDRQDEFDRETDHGRSRGVEVTLTERCRKKKSE
jgi:predicted secreted Zn-dependent protease